MAISLTAEQREFMRLAKEGRNVLVDACIGSGKTTAIQHVCSELPREGRILYLTYNRRLLLDARARIRQPNVDVHTYHSLAGTHLSTIGRRDIPMRKNPMGFVELVQELPEYNTIVVDEYQDLERDLAKMLLHIAVVRHRAAGHTPQFLIVGDLDQKIYDTTRFDSGGFVKWFMDKLDGEWSQVTFSACFRLPPAHAANIGSAWHKSILGMNPHCDVRVEHNLDKLVKHLSQVAPQNLLVLGSNGGVRSALQNSLEQIAPDVFNKRTVYSSIQDADSSIRTTDTSKAAIFTTYDAAKGLEREVCVVCNFTDRYLDSRMRYSTSPSILRNLFLVAASRGKKEIVFYVPQQQHRLLFRELGELSGATKLDTRVEDIDRAFHYRHHEDLDLCLSFIHTEQVQKPGRAIQVNTTDGMIDLGQCYGVYALARFFAKWDIDYSVAEAERMLESACEAMGDEMGPVLNLPDYDDQWPLWRKVLFLTATRTAQERYFTQISKPFVDRDAERALLGRMRTLFKGDEDVDIPCEVVFREVDYDGGQSIREKDMCGLVDVRSASGLYKVFFGSQISDERRIAAAVTCVAMGAPYVTLWNLYDNTMEQVSVPDEESFMSAVCACVTNGRPLSGMTVLPDRQPAITYDVGLVGQPETGLGQIRANRPRKKAPAKTKAKGG